VYKKSARRVAFVRIPSGSAAETSDRGIFFGVHSAVVSTYTVNLRAAVQEGELYRRADLANRLWVHRLSWDSGHILGT
jgi:hypothetical protein